MGKRVDHWDEFVAGKCYLRIEKRDWETFADKCEQSGMRWAWSRADHKKEVFGVDNLARRSETGNVCFGRIGFMAKPNHPIYEFVPAENDAYKIIILTDGKTTTARLYENGRVVKEGKAVRAESDKFNFMDGAIVSMQRLQDGPNAHLLDAGEMKRWASDLEKISQQIFKVAQ